MVWLFFRSFTVDRKSNFAKFAAIVNFFKYIKRFLCERTFCTVFAHFFSPPFCWKKRHFLQNIPFPALPKEDPSPAQSFLSCPQKLDFKPNSNKSLCLYPLFLGGDSFCSGSPKTSQNTHRPTKADTYYDGRRKTRTKSVQIRISKDDKKNQMGS